MTYSREDFEILLDNYLARKYRIQFNNSRLTNAELSQYFGVFLTMNDMEKLFHIKRDGIMAYIRNGRLKGAKVANRWRFYRGNVIEFWESLVAENNYHVADNLFELYGKPPESGKAGMGGRYGKRRSINPKR